MFEQKWTTGSLWGNISIRWNLNFEFTYRYYNNSITLWILWTNNLFSQKIEFKKKKKIVGCTTLLRLWRVSSSHWFHGKFQTHSRAIFINFRFRSIILLRLWNVSSSHTIPCFCQPPRLLLKEHHLWDQLETSHQNLQHQQNISHDCPIKKGCSQLMTP